MNEYQQIKRLLTRLEGALLRYGYWEQTPPSKEALSSVAPFAIDTLDCTQWLQWIFIPKMQHLIENKMPLPTSFAISPYIEETFCEGHKHEKILRISKELDAFFDKKFN